MADTVDVLQLFQEKSVVKVAAPMVRYSKLQFRTLVRKYGCDLCFTPMIMANSFLQSSKARNNEFTTNSGDTPLIVQFAAKSVKDFVGAAELVAPYCAGVDLNCGCPQRWAMKDGYGAHLLSKPHLVADLVHQLRNRIPNPFTVSVKIRILEDVRRSIELCRQLEAAGAAFLSVHARTPGQRNEPINVGALRDIRHSVSIPIIANGDIKSLEDVHEMQHNTGCQGVMAASGLLQNPALFSGELKTPLSCVEDWLSICSDYEVAFQCFHHHLVFMLERLLPKAERRLFNVLNTKASIIEYLHSYFSIPIPSFKRIKYSNLYPDMEPLTGLSYSSKLAQINAMEDYLDDCYDIYCT